MNITVCDLCRKEVEPPGARMALQIKSEPVQTFKVEDLCLPCVESITAFLDGLKNGPPGVSMMLPKPEPEKKETKK